MVEKACGQDGMSPGLMYSREGMWAGSHVSRIVTAPGVHCSEKWNPSIDVWRSIF